MIGFCFCFLNGTTSLILNLDFCILFFLLLRSLIEPNDLKCLKKRSTRETLTIQLFRQIRQNFFVRQNVKRFRMKPLIAEHNL